MLDDHDLIIDTHTLNPFHSLTHSQLCIVLGVGHGLFQGKTGWGKESKYSFRRGIHGTEVVLTLKVVGDLLCSGDGELSAPSGASHTVP